MSDGGMATRSSPTRHLARAPSGGKGSHRVMCVCVCLCMCMCVCVCPGKASRRRGAEEKGQPVDGKKAGLPAAESHES